VPPFLAEAPRNYSFFTGKSDLSAPGGGMPLYMRTARPRCASQQPPLWPHDDYRHPRP
jgi:hypothetical protein